MDNSGQSRRAAARPRLSLPDTGANVSPQDGEVIEIHSPKENQSGADRMVAAGRVTDRRHSAPQLVHMRHMPKEPNKFHIPRKTKVKMAPIQYVSSESREFEDMMNILNSGYFDPGSASSFSYSKPRLVHSELLEKEFVERRKEMKADGRTDKELEESYCFLLAEAATLPQLCENGLCVGQSWITVLGNPNKGVYLSRYSDLLQVNPLTPGGTGEIVIFKVLKGKVKSIYENVKNLLDPTPRFDSHIYKNASNVTSLTSYRAFEFTQQYFYEYSFDELRERPRQVCPYAVVSFQFKEKDRMLPRAVSQPVEKSKERAEFTLWSGDLVKGERVLCQISLRSFSPPFLPHRVPERLEIGCVMRFDQAIKLLPSDIFSYNLYNDNREVAKSGHCCRLLEVIDRGRSTGVISKLLQEMEIKKVILVTPLSERGFLFLLSSVQMATPAERGESWKRCLQALFVFPETRDVVKSTSHSFDASDAMMPQLNRFVPALHHALIKARANPSANLSAGVECQARDYLSGLKDGKVRPYPMGQYDSKQDEQNKVFPTPKHHLVNLNSYMCSYLTNPAMYLLSAARARQVVETHCGPEEKQLVQPGKSCMDQGEAAKEEGTGTTGDGESSKKIQQLLDLVLTCKRNAENEVKREERRDGLKTLGRKRKLEQRAAARAIKFLKAAHGPAGHHKIPVEDKLSTTPYSLQSVIGSLGLREADLRESGSEPAAKLLHLLTGLSQDACRLTGKEEEQRESCPFGRLATKLGLPANCDIDLRKQEELEEQTAESVSSLEGFSPGSHSGEMNQHRTSGGREKKGAGGYEDDEEEWEIPWVLIPITGLGSRRYPQKDRILPQDPRFQHLREETTLTTTTKPRRKSPAQSPEPSPLDSPLRGSFPETKPSVSHFLSSDSSPPLSPSRYPSSEPGAPSSPSRCQPSRLGTPPFSTSSTFQLRPPPSLSGRQSPEPMEHNHLTTINSGYNEEFQPPTSSREFTGTAKDKQVETQEKNTVDSKPSFPTSVQPSVPQAAEKRTSSSSTLPVQEKPYPQSLKSERKEINANKTQQVTKVQKEKAATGHKTGGEEKEGHLRAEVTNQKETMEEEGKRVVSPTAQPQRDIDSIVDRNIDNFFTEMQLLLQEERIPGRFSQTPHTASHTEAATPQHVPSPHCLTTPFSHYISTHHPCPPVQDYVSSLHDGIENMMTEFGGGTTHERAQTEADAVLARSVSAYVSSIRAANSNTERCDDTSAPVTSASTTGGHMWRNQQPVVNSRLVVTVPTSVSDSTYKPSDLPLLHPPSSNLPSRTVELSRTVTQTVRQTAGDGFTKTLECTSNADTGSSLTTVPHTEVPVSSFAPKTSTEASDPDSASASEASVAPQPTTLNSLINTLEPEVFSSLMKIIKDVKKNSVQFYIHSTDPLDQVFMDVKQYLLKQGNVEQTPVAFLNQEKPNSRLMVIIKNKDIAEHIHKVPNLVSLKRRSSVLFVGIDSLDDIKNNSYNELFVSGGCIISDEFILNPDVINEGRLADLLKLLEQHNSLESVWKWKIHCKTHKKLKELARIRKEAANVLELLSVYQKQQIVEFLPYHHCDMANHQSPDLDCVIELQARYTQYRHTIFLTERCLKNSPNYISGGIIVAGIEETLHKFSRLVGYHNIKDRQPLLDTTLTSKGLDSQLSPSDSVLGSERSPSVFPEHTHLLASVEKHQHLFLQPGFGFLSRPHPSDQLVPDASCKDVMPQPSDTDFEVLSLAISQLRAERQARLLQQQQQQQQQQEQQQQQLDSKLELKMDSPRSPTTNPISRGSGHSSATPQSRGAPTTSTQGTSSRKAVAATLDFIHSALQEELQEVEKEEVRVKSMEEQKREKKTTDSRGDSGDGPSVRVTSSEENQGPSKCNASTSSFTKNTSAVTTTGERNLTNAETITVQDLCPQTDAATCSTTSCPTGADKARDSRPQQEQPKREVQAQSRTVENVSGSVAALTSEEDKPIPVISKPQWNHQPKQWQSYPSHHQPLLHATQQLQQQQQWGSSYLHPHLLSRYSGQPLSVAPMLRPHNALRGARGYMGPTAVWPSALGPAGGANLAWGFPHSVSGMYHNPTTQGSNMYRGGQRGGFNGT